MIRSRGRYLQTWRQNRYGPQPRRLTVGCREEPEFAARVCDVGIRIMRSELDLHHRLVWMHSGGQEGRRATKICCGAIYFVPPQQDPRY